MLAFVAAGLSFSVLVYSFVRTGAIQATPLFGGLLMLALGLGGYSRLRQPPG
jgi:sulfite exporter TauE/SafE